MLRLDSKNVNFNGASIVNDVQIASFSASVTDPNYASVSASIDNYATYRANIDAFKLDFANFVEEFTKVTAEVEEEEE